MIVTALLLGFAGSFHCIGMCSPLAMAVTNRSPKFLLSTIVYNVGRILTYAIVGCVIASIGQMLPLQKYQGIISIVIGLLLLAIGLTGTSIRLGIVTVWLTRLSIFIKGRFIEFLKQRDTSATFFMGMLNGALPCGLSFLALTYCVTLAGPLEGFYFMLLFGVGTIPAMVGLSAVMKRVVEWFPVTMRKFTTIMFVLAGVLLIARVFIVHIPHGKTLHERAADIVVCGR